MLAKFKCKSMDDAGALHNAFLDHLHIPEGCEVDANIQFDGYNGWFVTVEERPRQEKAPLESEASSRGD
jgi:hypothetical protein